MALGARDNQVLTQVVRQGMTWVGIGLGIGLLGGYGMARAISTIFFGVGTGGVLIYAFVVAVLLVVGTLANLIPARRAAQVNPMGALRAGE
jgi:ABC-type antimicrobial peptide transport system permease subunit